MIPQPIKRPSADMAVLPTEDSAPYRGPRSGIPSKRGRLPPLTPQEAVSTPAWTVRLLLIGAGLVALALATKAMGVW